MKKFLLFYLFLTLAGINFSSAQSNALIGTCYGGGAHSRGSIFQANLDGSNVHAIYSFLGPEGAMPWGKTAQAPNGKIYGVTYMGGCSDSCTLYEYDPVSAICLDVYDFYCTPPAGEPSQGGLIILPDGNLYGHQMNGILYRFNPNTHVYTLLNQTSVTYYGGLMQASDGKLYGVSLNGGTGGYGTIFSYDLTSNVYTVLYNFDGIHGRSPYYVNLIQATDGKLYGTTYMGGAHSLGVIFSFDISTNTYTDLYDFDTTNQTYCSLIQASNGKLYGNTYFGGTANKGVIFSYDILEAQFSVLYNFSGTDGANPQRSLIQAGNGKLIGTTYMGGLYSNGVAFSFDIESNTYTKLADFNNTMGDHPECVIMEATMPGPTAIAKDDALQGLIYLDAATHQLTVQNFKQGDNARLTVFDTPGRTIFQIEIRSQQSEFDLSAYPDGIYFVRLQNAGQTMTRKIILSR